MRLEWMEKHRSLVEQLIRYGNTYAFTFRKQRSFGTELFFSASQIQTLEYILEAEDSNETMSEMAQRLGVSKATFSKNVAALEEKGLLEKFHYVGNQKNIYVKATEYGRDLYQRYTEYVCENLFDEIFRIADKMSPEDIDNMKGILSHFSDRLLWYQDENNDVEQEKELVKISKKKSKA